MKKIMIAIIVLTLIGCKEQKVDTKTEGEKVMQLSKEWSTVASTGDVEKTVNYWTDDAIVISADEGTLKGKSAIRKMVEHGYKMPGFRISWQPQSVEVSESGDMAYTTEDTQISYNDSTGKPITYTGKAVRIWRKRSGTWKTAVDISTPAQ